MSIEKTVFKAVLDCESDIRKIVLDYQLKAIEVVNASRLPEFAKAVLVEEIRDTWFNDDVVVDNVMLDLISASIRGVHVESFELFVEGSSTYEHLQEKLADEQMREELACVANRLDELAMKMYIDVYRIAAPRLGIEVKIPSEAGWIVRLEKKL